MFHELIHFFSLKLFLVHISFTCVRKVREKVELPASILLVNQFIETDSYSSFIKTGSWKHYCLLGNSFLI